MKAFGAQAKQLMELKFLGTYDFVSFQCELGHGGKTECKMQKGSAVEKAAEPLDAEDTWDSREYGPLSDIVPGKTKTNGSDFIAKLVKEKEMQDNMLLVEFVDEEGTKRDILVHESYKKILETDCVYVIHRAKILDGEGMVDEWYMLAKAPLSYTWSEEE